MPAGEEKLIKIGALANLGHVLPSTIHFYTKEGLLSFASSTRGGYRLYSKEKSLKRLKRIQHLQKFERLTIPEIRKELRG